AALEIRCGAPITDRSIPWIFHRTPAGITRGKKSASVPPKLQSNASAHAYASQIAAKRPSRARVRTLPTVRRARASATLAKGITLSSSASRRARASVSVTAAAVAAELTDTRAPEHGDAGSLGQAAACGHDADHGSGLSSG